MIVQKKLQRQLILAISGAMLLFPSVSVATNLTKLPIAEKIRLRIQNLEGFDALAPMPHLSATTWMDSQFQQGFEKWFNAKFGARNFLVRFNNEILFRIFSRSYMYDGQLLVAKHQVLYELSYVKDLYHEATSQDKLKVLDFVHDLESLQEMLAQKGKAFVFVISPSKAALLRPTLTAWFQPAFAKHRVYDELLEQLKQSHLHYVDGHVITETTRSEGKQIFPSGGTHWNDPTAARTLNQVLVEINRQRGSHIPMLELQKISPGYPENVESDLAQLLNRLVPNYRFPVDHAKIQLSESARHERPEIIFEGTSFTGQLAELTRRTKLADNFSYYFYGTRKMTYEPGKSGVPVDADIASDKNLLSADAVVIENNEALDFDHAKKFANILRASLASLPDPPAPTTSLPATLPLTPTSRSNPPQPSAAK